jgi:hypothetical protein
LHVKVRLLPYVAVLTGQTIAAIVVVMTQHSSLSVLEMCSDSSPDSDKTTIGVQLKKALQVETHVSDNHMCWSDYEIRQALGVVSSTLHYSSAFPPGIPQLWIIFIITPYFKNIR